MLLVIPLHFFGCEFYGLVFYVINRSFFSFENSRSEWRNDVSTCNFRTGHDLPPAMSHKRFYMHLTRPLTSLIFHASKSSALSEMFPPRNQENPHKARSIQGRCLLFICPSVFVTSGRKLINLCYIFKLTMIMRVKMNFACWSIAQYEALHWGLLFCGFQGSFVLLN